MAKKALIPIANGTEEMEAVIIIDMFRRAKIEVTVAANYSPVKCSRAVKIIPDTTIQEALRQEYDAIIIPGGLDGAKELAADKTLSEILAKHKETDSIIGAICAAPIVLKSNNLIEDKNITSHPSVKTEFDINKYSENNVEKDGNIFTSRGAGTAFELSLKIIEELVDKTTSENISEAIVLSK